MKETRFCAQGERYLFGYLEHSLPPAEAQSYRAHLEQCQLCQQEAELWTRLGADARLAAAPVPGPDFVANFNAMLAQQLVQQDGKTAAGPASLELKPGLRWGRAGVWAAAAALVVAGFLGGLVAGGLGAGGGAFRPGASGKTEVAELRQEVRMMRSLVAVSLMQQQSTSERLRGVSYSTGLENPDEQVVAALLRTLRADTSVDVRMAAADALRRYSGRAPVRQSMAEALQLESSPLVQLTLIDALVATRESKAAPALRVLMAEEGLDPTVRQRAMRALGEIQAEESRPMQ
jgi:hypothetical protein